MMLAMLAVLLVVIAVLLVLTFGVVPVLREIFNELVRLGKLLDFMVVGADRE